MEQRSIRQIAAWTGGRYEGPDFPVDGVEIDSRKVGPGSVFLALRGTRRDGHDFLGEAFASGAAAALVDRMEAARAHLEMGRAIVCVDDVRRALGAWAAAHRKSLDLDVIAVTGSNGKTTTKEMLRLLLGNGAIVSPQSFNNDLGVPLTLLEATRRHSVCVVELGTNAPGEIAALSAIARPDVGIVLNVGEAHLAGLRSLSGVAREKGALVEALGPDGCAVLNFDDAYVRDMANLTSAFVMTFGTWPGADVYGGEVRTRGRTVSFKLLHKKRVTLKTLGVHNVHNALAAAGAAMWLGHHPFDICERLEAFRPAPMRLSEEGVAGVRLINDAYNANPRSTEAAILEVSYRGGAGRRVLVLGDMLELGAQGPALHERIGALAARSRIDVLWTVGALGEAAAHAARKAGMRQVFWSPDVESALSAPPFLPASGDVVLFKASRGMRLERVYDAVRGRLKARSAQPRSGGRKGSSAKARA